jgi:YgiT-type zinc finger domain-containing protein
MYGYRCEYCEGTVQPRTVKQEAFKHRDGFVILENVAIGVCNNCGNRYYSANILHKSRRTARTSATGDLILLEDQNRSLWNQSQISEGKILVQRSLSSLQFGSYTLQAAIAAVYTDAPTSAVTDWAQIVALYNLLFQAEPSPIVELNRAVAVAMRDGFLAGLHQIDEIRSSLSAMTIG